MAQLLSWVEVLGLIELHYAKSNRCRPPVGLEWMLRAYLVRHWYETGASSVYATSRGALSTASRFGRLRRTGKWAVEGLRGAAQMPPATACPKTSDNVRHCGGRRTGPAPAGLRRECGSVRRVRTRPSPCHWPIPTARCSELRPIVSKLAKRRCARFPAVALCDSWRR